MSETKFCVNCKKYAPSIWAGDFYPERCTHSEEVSPVTGKPMMMFPGQGRVTGVTILVVRKEYCKGDWFEEKPIDVQATEVPLEPALPEAKPAKPWWRFW